MKIDRQHSQSTNDTRMEHKIPVVVFIDDGINPDFVPEGVCFDSYVIDENKVKEDNTVYENTHGTRCFEVFRDRVKAPYHLISLKVLNEAIGIGKHKAMVTALHWCSAHSVDLINMSMGTTQYSDFAAVVDAVKNLSHIPIVAACSNSNTLTFPACLPSVIGIRYLSSALLKEDYFYVTNSYDHIDVFVNDKEIHPSDYYVSEHIAETSIKSNSLATPVITAHICNYIAKENIGIDDIRQRLKADAFSDNSIVDYNLYKELFHEWEELSVPIVALLDEDYCALAKLRNLLGVFIQDGYRAVAFTGHCSSDVSNLIFPLKWIGEGHVSLVELIELYYNFTLPDIIFLHTKLHNIDVLPDKLQPDIVIAHNWESLNYRCCSKTSILDSGESTDSLFLTIQELLS